MSRIAIGLALIGLLMSSMACCCCSTVPLPSLPSIGVSQFEVGEMQTYTEEVPAAGVDAAEVDILFGAGELALAAGDPDVLLQGAFRTNVAEWAPNVDWTGGRLSIEQGSTRGVPSGNARNEWELYLSPLVALDMRIRAGASDTTLDLGGLALTQLELETGASNTRVRFDEPNLAEMRDLTIRAGAADLNVTGIGNASPRRVEVEGGVGSITLDLTGDWAQSSSITITAGTGSLVLRLPADVGVRVQVGGGLSSVEIGSGLLRSGNAYVNSAYDTAETELDISVTVGVGSVRLELVGE